MAWESFKKPGGSELLVRCHYIVSHAAWGVTFPLERFQLIVSNPLGKLCNGISYVLLTFSPSKLFIITGCTPLSYCVRKGGVMSSPGCFAINFACMRCICVVMCCAVLCCAALRSVTSSFHSLPFPSSLSLSLPHSLVPGCAHRQGMESERNAKAFRGDLGFLKKLFQNCPVSLRNFQSLKAPSAYMDSPADCLRFLRLHYFLVSVLQAVHNSSSMV